MKSTTYTDNDLAVKQISNLRISGRQVQRTVEKSSAGENSPELKIILAYSSKQPAAETKQPAAETNQACKTKIYIKNMVSIRCKMVVKAVLENLGLFYTTVELGEVEIIGDLSDEKHKQVSINLLKFGLELVEERKIILVEQVKNLIIEMIHYSDELPDIKFSDYLSEKLNHSYPYLSNLFSEVKGMSIQHYILVHKIEKVKELLMYDDLSLSEIAWKLHYSSVAHLSNQFKKISGLTPSYFKKVKNKRLMALDNL